MEQQAKVLAKIPGPAQYQSEESMEFGLPEGGRLNRNPKGPGFMWPEEGGFLKYNPRPGFAESAARPVDKDKHAKHGFGSGGALSRQPLDDLAKAMTEMPGPAQYQGQEFQEAGKPFFPEGGRFSSCGRDSDFTERASRHHALNPGPGHYEDGLPGSINGNKGIGKLVWRYESATIAESKKLVTKAMGVKNDPPGPGAYTIPDPPVIAHPPSMKGRSGGAMPHMPQLPRPVAQHPAMAGLSPDSVDKFSGPLREQNSGDQIFGRDLRKGAATSGGKGPGSRPHTGEGGGDRLHQGELPFSVGASVFDAPEENAVQWRAGGFSVIKKSKSASAVQQKPAHPSMEAAQKHYLMLSRHHKRDEKAFLPMATRKNNGFTPVPTHKASNEHQQLCRSKWLLADVLDNLGKATAAALEPLNEEKMRHQALESLKEKAEERMRLEGVAHEQQALVLAELPKVFEEKVLRSTAGHNAEEVNQGKDGEQDGMPNDTEETAPAEPTLALHNQALATTEIASS